MKKIFCFIMVCLYVLLCPICAVAKDTGICSTGNELFYHSLVGKGAKIGLPIEAFSRLSKPLGADDNVHMFKYPDNSSSDYVSIALVANSEGYTDSIAIAYTLNGGETPPAVNTIINLCMKTCFITDSEYLYIFKKIANFQFDSYWKSPSGHFMGGLLFYSSINKKDLYATVSRDDGSDIVVFMISSYPKI